MLPAPRPSRALMVLAAAATLAFAAPASAQPAAEPADPAAATSPPPTATAAAPAGGGFGTPATWVFSFETADSGYGFAFFHTVSGSGGRGTTTVTLNPAVDYFLAPNVSLGANLSFTHSTGNGSLFGGGVRAGYNLPLTENVGLWPTARFFVMHDPTPATNTSLGVFAPFLWHATTHFFLGAGPDLNVALSGGNGTEFGLDFTLGGWL